MSASADEVIPVALRTGTVELSSDVALPEDAWAAVAVAHGAGAGYRHPFLVGFTDALTAAGIATLRFNLPYAQAGRRMPGPAAHAVAAWGAVHAWLSAHVEVPVWACGKSYGGRMASMAAAEGVIEPAGLVYLGYPLHPPGDRSKARTAHLPEIVPPQLFLSGTNDPFVDPHDQLVDAVAACRDAELTWIEGGGHSFEVAGRKRPADEIGAELAPIVAEFLRRRGPEPRAVQDPA
ncbi:alpha/beta family hydrolase [Microbacterium sp. NPDC055910]|uniref:alpha/beta hydrolase family protein n=1 Tax=Microbacterium sp. NPDC055910 TaxID=3345659 RepID=UPI0035E24FC3